MGIIKKECPYCSRRVFIDSRELDEDAEVIICNHCGETIELSKED